MRGPSPWADYLLVVAVGDARLCGCVAAAGFAYAADSNQKSGSHKQVLE